MRTTLKETLELWKKGKLHCAYAMYKQDEGSMDVSFERFCKVFPTVKMNIERRIEQEEINDKARYID